MASIEAECPSCGGSGIYKGFAEPKGVGVVCLTCGGAGKKDLVYEPFTGLKTVENIDIVRRSAGTLLATGLGPLRVIQLPTKNF